MQSGIYLIWSDESSINLSYKGEKLINIVLEIEMTQLFWDTFFWQLAQLLWDGGSIR